MTLTHVFSNPANASLRALVSAQFNKLEWRHHGIGVLQAYLMEDSDPEVRVHIWCKDLVKPGMDVSGDIHDHRFRLVSHVLCGTVLHEEIRTRDDSRGDWAMLELTHARAAKESLYHGPTKPIPGRWSIDRVWWEISEGHTYSYPPGYFHRSPLPEDGSVSITVVEKHDQTKTPARILHPRKTPPVMAFGHDMDWGIIHPVLHKARELLRLDVVG